MPSPFLLGHPVPPNLHLGRDRPLARVLERIAHHGQSTAIIGDPRIGKTSFLLVVAASHDTLLRADCRHLILSYLDSYAIDRGLADSEFWDIAVSSLDSADSHLPIDSPVIRALHSWRTSGHSSRRLPQLFAALRDASVRLVLLIDEFDHLVRNRITDPRSFFGTLRAAATTSGSLALVVASRTPLADLDEYAQGDGFSGSPYFNYMTEEILGPLTTDEIDTLLSRAEGRFCAADQAVVRTLAAGHPYFLQLVADSLYRALEDGSIDPHAEATDRALREAARTLANLWRYWPAQQRFVLASIAFAAPFSTSRFRGPIDTAVGQGYLRRDGLGLDIAPSLLKMWIHRKFLAHADSDTRWHDWLGPEEHQISLSSADRQSWIHAVRTQLSSPSVPPPSRQPAAPQRRRARTFISYSHVDERYRERLDTHLAALLAEDLIETWGDHRIGAGHDRATAHDAALREADIILLLVSADFLSFADTDLEQAMARHREGTAHVIPIAVRAADWGELPIASLQALPRNGRPVAQWLDQDDAWFQVAQEIRRIVTGRWPRSS